MNVIGRLVLVDSKYNKEGSETLAVISDFNLIHKKQTSLQLAASLFQRKPIESPAVDLPENSPDKDDDSFSFLSGFTRTDSIARKPSKPLPGHVTPQLSVSASYYEKEILQRPVMSKTLRDATTRRTSAFASATERQLSTVEEGSDANNEDCIGDEELAELGLDVPELHATQQQANHSTPAMESSRKQAKSMFGREYVKAIDKTLIRAGRDPFGVKAPRSSRWKSLKSMKSARSFTPQHVQHQEQASHTTGDSTHRSMSTYEQPAQAMSTYRRERDDVDTATDGTTTAAVEIDETVRQSFSWAVIYAPTTTGLHELRLENAGAELEAGRVLVEVFPNSTAPTCSTVRLFCHLLVLAVDMCIPDSRRRHQHGHQTKSTHSIRRLSKQTKR